MKTSPLILVVTPTLGVSDYLEETVASVATQGIPLLHVLVTPARMVASLQARYRHTLVIADAGPAGGIYGALNAALARSATDWDWFTYINDDDRLRPGFGAMARRHFNTARPAPVAYGLVDLIDEAGERISTITCERDPAWIPALLQQGISPLMQQGTLFRRDCVGRLQGFDTRYRLCADLDFWLRACAAGERFQHYDLTVGEFRLRGGQLSGDTQLTVREQTDIVRRHLPVRLPAWRRHAAVLRYRLHNLPHYLERGRRRGLRTSYRLLESTP
jgi:hypothetical protein